MSTRFREEKPKDQTKSISFSQFFESLQSKTPGPKKTLTKKLLPGGLEEVTELDAEGFNFSGLKKERKTAGNNNLRIRYEPPMFSAREVRKWEKMSGKSWYALNCQERHLANIEMGKMAEEEKESKTKVKR